uniref:Uncharacterized protein n=1 Tax=Nelumbo nucifera TaxID=4432 RepID=A0A822ZT31_NELNU|nr:TPA_asm: hypothetical protein HUJ06_016648 [Nelumbo nucifera]
MRKGKKICLPPSIEKALGNWVEASKLNYEMQKERMEVVTDTGNLETCIQMLNDVF